MPVPEPDRYEPLPGVTELPGRLWRKLGRGGRIAVGLALLALVAGGVALAPGITESKEERAESEQREREERRERLARELREEQRPHLARSAAVAPAGAPAEERLAARARLMDDLAATILADARRRVREGDLSGPIDGVGCEPFPRSVGGVGADEDLSRGEGRYSCVAATAALRPGEENLGVVIGHRYRATVNFESGRFGYCKISGQAGPEREQLATIPRACGGE